MSATPELASLKGYASYYWEEYEEALQFQDYVVDLLLCQRKFVVQTLGSRKAQWTCGESLTGVEIKHDKQYATSRKLWIEVAEKRDPQAAAFVASGILRADNGWLYVIGDRQHLFAFSKRRLVGLYTAGRYPVRLNNKQTGYGFLVPEAQAIALADFTEPASLQSKPPPFVAPTREPGEDG